MAAWLRFSCAVAASLPLVMGVAGAAAKTPAKKPAPVNDPLSVIGTGASAETVKVAGQPDGTFKGTSSIPLSNSSQTRVNVTVAYYAQQPSDSVKITSTHPVSVPARGSATLTLAAVITPPAVPSDLNGTVVITERDAKHEKLGTLPLAVQGALIIPTDVAFEPSEITLQVTLGQWFKAAGETQTVRIRGPGVAQLVNTVNALADAGDIGTLLLSDGSGQQTLVQLSRPALIGPGLAEVTVCVRGAEHCGKNTPSPGAYTGTFSLSPGESGAPTLKVTVNSRYWLVLPIILVLIGAALGGLLPAWTATARTKNTLRDELRSYLAAYERTRPANPNDRAAWDMTPLLGDEKDWYTKRYTGAPDAKGVAPLWADIHSASAGDLDRDAAAVTELTSQVTAWMQAEPLAAALATLRDNPPEDRVGHRWQDTQVRDDTAILLDEVRNAVPPDAAGAAEYVRRLSAQLRLHQEYVHAWELCRRLDKQPRTKEEEHENAEAWKSADLDAFDKLVAAAPEADRKPSAQSKLNLELADVTEAIERLLVAPNQDTSPATADIALTARQRVTVADQLVGRRPVEQVAKTAGVDQGVVREVSAELAPVIEAKAPQPVEEVSSSWFTHLLDTTDVVLTGVIAVGTAAAYILPAYTATWGSAQDWAAALAAGIGGQVVIKWAALPALRSKRLPASGAVATADA
jgi:hypothetical protein